MILPGRGAGTRNSTRRRVPRGSKGHWLPSISALLVLTPSPCALSVQAWPFQSQLSASMLAGFDKCLFFFWNIPPRPYELFMDFLRQPVPPPPGSHPWPIIQASFLRSLITLGLFDHPVCPLAFPMSDSILFPTHRMRRKSKKAGPAEAHRKVGMTRHHPAHPSPQSYSPADPTTFPSGKTDC